MSLEPEGISFDRIADPSKTFHSFSEMHRVAEYPSRRFSMDVTNDLYSLGDASIMRMSDDGSKVYLIHNTCP